MDPNDQTGRGWCGRQVKIEFEWDVFDFGKGNLADNFLNGGGDRAGRECDKEEKQTSGFHANADFKLEVSWLGRINSIEWPTKQSERREKNG